MRDGLPDEVRRQKSRRIKEALLRHPFYLSAEYILCYVNYRTEVETLGLIEESLTRHKRVYCPLVCGKSMDFYEIASIEELQEGFHGILEPPKREDGLFVPEGREACTLLVMPGAVFDKKHHRIGYGGGYYDRYLQRAGQIATVAVAFSFQVKEAVPYEVHDVCPQRILTEDGEF